MDPRYPIGKFAMPAQVTPVQAGKQAIDEIAATPAKTARGSQRPERRAARHALSRRAAGRSARSSTTFPTAT